MTIGTRWLRAAPAAVMAAGALMMLAWGLAGGGESVQAANASVNAHSNPLGFTPSTVAILNGEKVTWTVTSGTHQIVNDVGETETFDSGAISSGAADPTFEWTFGVQNTDVGFHCAIHPSMQGTVRVGTPPNTPTNTPVTPTATRTNTPTATNTTTTVPATNTPTTSPTPTTTVTRHEVIAPNAAKN